MAQIQIALGVQLYKVKVLLQSWKAILFSHHDDIVSNDNNRSRGIISSFMFL